jgi:prefoldin subunit 5
METDEEKLNKERQELLAQLQVLDQRRNDIMVRLIEIQGALKFLEEKKKEQKGQEKK